MFGVHSSARSSTLFDTSRERRGDARRVSQHHLRGHWIADAVRQVETRGVGTDARGQHSDRQERADARQHPRVRHVHLCRRLRPRKHRVGRGSQSQRSVVVAILEREYTAKLDFKDLYNTVVLFSPFIYLFTLFE